MQAISLIIPTHNRHQYLDRILEYYGHTPFKIYIADSTDTPYVFKYKIEDCTYLHLPGKSLTQKLSFTLQGIETPLLVMCADDDFTFIRGIKACAAFLSDNTDYVAVMGNAVCYRKDSLKTSSLQFAAMYTNRVSFNISHEDPFERLETFFRNYRSIFYAVHRTNVLLEAFSGADMVVTNLFLNEYLTVILPLIKGKVAELPVLYQVREYAADSGDKTIMNLDVIMEDGPHLPAYLPFLEYESSVIAKATGRDITCCRNELHKLLAEFASRLQLLKSHTDESLIKRLGSLVQLLPVAGKKIIHLFRLYKENKRLQLFIRSSADKSDLKTVRDLIWKYRYAIDQ